jgi:hypothetical protein
MANVIEVENLAEFPVLVRVQEIDFAGMVGISAGDEYLKPRPKNPAKQSKRNFELTFTLSLCQQRGLIKE